MDEQPKQNSNKKRKAKQYQEKRQYVKPELKEYGCIEKLTQGPGGTKVEGLSRRP